MLPPSQPAPEVTKGSRPVLQRLLSAGKLVFSFYVALKIIFDAGQGRAAGPSPHSCRIASNSPRRVIKLGIRGSEGGQEHLSRLLYTFVKCICFWQAVGESGGAAIESWQEVHILPQAATKVGHF